MTGAEFAAVKARVEAQADDDCERGLRDLDARLATVDEWVISGDAGGRRLVLPERATMQGMAAHLRESLAVERERRARL